MGGRSGITAITTGILFIFSLLFSPLLAVVTSQVTAPALIIVGVLMAQSLSKIKWNEMEIAIPSFLILLGMPLTYSISDGIALGFIFYPITMIAAKTWERSFANYVWLVLCFCRIHVDPECAISKRESYQIVDS